MSFKIKKVLNNSSLLISNGTEEMIVVGKGIGFKKKPHDLVPMEHLIEQKYELIQEDDFGGSQHATEIVDKTAEILDIIVRSIDKEMDADLIAPLSKHIGAMLARLENSIFVTNPFHTETKVMYEKSYEKAIEIGAEIYETLDIVLPESEIDFLTLYIHTILSESPTNRVEKNNAIVAQIIMLLETDYGMVLDKSSIAFARFITHLKFMVQRIMKEEKFQGVFISPDFYEQNQKYFEMSQAILRSLEQEFDTTLDEQEHAYIILHLARLDTK